MKHGKCLVCGSTKTQFIKQGGSLLNKALNALPLPEMHLKSAVGAEQVPNGSFNNTGRYSFCGPYTKLEKRLAEGYRGVNSLDRACKDHDIAYAKYSDTATRNSYDDILADQATKIVMNPDAPGYEKADARLVAALMAGKSRLGMGFRVN